MTVNHSETGDISASYRFRTGIDLNYLSEYALSRTIFDYGHHLLQLSSNSSTRWEQCWQEAEVGSMTRQVIIVDIIIDIIIIITDIIIIIITQHRGHKVILE